MPTAESAASRPSPFTFEQLRSVCPAWVLPSETGSGYVIRLHETAGGSGSALLRLARPTDSVTLVDFREREMAAARRIDDTTYAINYTPYQIVSVLVRHEGSN